MRKTGTVGLLLIAFVFSFAWAVTGKESVDEVCIPMGSFLLEPPNSVTVKRPPVDFPHSRHFDFSCKTCHHEWDFDTQVQTCTTSGCHDLTETPKKPDKGTPDKTMAIRYFKTAFHNTCIGCHKSIKQKNIEEEKKLRVTDKNTKIMKTGPLSCKECHQPE